MGPQIIAQGAVPVGVSSSNQHQKLLYNGFVLQRWNSKTDKAVPAGTHSSLRSDVVANESLDHVRDARKVMGAPGGTKQHRGQALNTVAIVYMTCLVKHENGKTS